ncbi:MAG TPA: tRNA pseudouridine(38-40) synthase TruA, partial [Terriglobales bacterium]|nr:tRNA pseudouridine(38-40) synthase TruA [Terriglobales bacterium]
MRYKATIEYDGTDLHGWQIQPGLRTAQSELEAALQRLTGSHVRIAAAGRTDAGVHASGQVIAFALDKEWPPQTLQRALNAVAPEDIAVRSVECAGDQFDPRRHASSRAYVYRIWNARTRSPFWRRYAWQVYRRLDVAAMQRAAAALCGTHDFTSFRAAGCDAEHAVRQIIRSQVEQQDELITYEIVATAFLRHMVRNVVGTLVEVGWGTRPADS